MIAQPQKTARVIRILSARSDAAAPLSTGEPEDLAEWLGPSREETVRQLEAWRAPSLPDEVVDTLGTIFLMHPMHTCLPFFVWIENRLRR